MPGRMEIFHIGILSWVTWLPAVGALLLLFFNRDKKNGIRGFANMWIVLCFLISIPLVTGLFKWGFYMDHLLDYVFLCSVLIGYALILPATSRYHMLLVLAVYGGFMVNAFLTFAATKEFNISYLRLGPTEFRIALIVINTLLIVFGTEAMKTALPYVAGFSLLGLSVIVYRTQKRIWRNDIEHKASLTGS